LKNIKINNMRVEINEELLRDIYHVTAWYQGREVDRMERVDEFVAKHLKTIEDNKTK